MSNGEIEAQQSLYKLNLNPQVSASSFDVPEEFRGTFSKLLNVTPEEQARHFHGPGVQLDVAKGFSMVPGKDQAYNSIIIRQARAC